MPGTISISQAENAAPLVEELSPAPAPEECFARLAALPYCVFFDSALREPTLGRYSFLAADPWEFLETAEPQAALASRPINHPHPGPLPEGEGAEARALARADALATLAAAIAPYESPTVAGLPPFQGGVAGLFSYDLGRQLERLPAPAYDEFRVPALAVGLYDVVVAWDHAANRAWLISQGWPQREPAARRRRAQERMAMFRGLLSQPAASPPAKPQAAAARNASGRALNLEELAPQFSVPGPAGLTSSFSEPQYLEAVARAIEYIRAGDVFQVNLAQRLLYPAADDSVALYLRLRQRNRATFAAYFDLGDLQIISASPERFVQVRGGEVEARPIKGTRRRSRWPEADLFAGSELRESEKDRAENVMIVDLLRNDLSRVCEPDSVRVTQLCGLEIYEYVQHLVSVVRGRLRPGATPLDLVRGAFPGGSVTGAPKVRAMEIIDELEPQRRGPYGGAVGYVDFSGNMDTCIALRTLVMQGQTASLQAGAGLVADSDPASEYQETLNKAKGLLKAIEVAQRQL